MAPLRISEPRRLTRAEIDAALSPGMIGAYALGSLRPDGSMSINYIGRADRDLAEQLKRHLGRFYDMFAYARAGSEIRAYELECELFHHYRPAYNAAHPLRPAGTSWQCPVCER